MSKSELERLVVEIQDAGQAWVEAKLRSDQLEADEKNYLAAIMNELDGAAIEGKIKLSEAKLERLARGGKGFRDYVVGRVMAQAETAKRKVRYEALQNYWEAKRSELAMEREKISKGIFHEGRG